MTDENYLTEVRAHYENYPYPIKNPEDEKTRLLIPVFEALSRLNYYCYSGKRDFTKPFRALVAGGGTGDSIIALAEQFNGHPAELVYIDMTKASMEVAQECIRIRGLDNVTWIHDSILNIPQLGLGQFDYINCSGVLHHLADPNEGLRILADSLKDDGAMGIMVYAKYGRTAVYQMQETLRLINKDEPNLQKRVDNARALLNRLPSTNWFFNSPPMIINETVTDIGIFDLLLHSQDRAYSVPELYDYVESAGLNILAMFSDDHKISNNLYNPLSYLADPALIEQVQKLSLREQQTLAELLNGKICKHTFYAAKYVPALPKPDDLEMIPIFGSNIAGQEATMMQLVQQAGDVIMFEQGQDTDNGSKVILMKTPHLEYLLKYIDGNRTTKEIFRKIMELPGNKTQNPNFQNLTEEFVILFQTFNRFNWMFLRQKASNHSVAPHVLQRRVEAMYASTDAV
jgi:SAM-dependent methyltransferase